MKILTPHFLAFIFLVLSSSLAGYSQIYQSVQEEVTIELINPKTKEIVFVLTSGLERILISSSGNFLRTVSFTIGPDEPIMNFSGPKRILEVKMYYDIDGDGTAEEITDTMAVLTRSGNLKLVFLSNGSGNRLPRGWDF